MRIGTGINYSGGFAESVADVVELEKAGLDVVFVPEAYSFDAVSQLGYLAAKTERVQLASGIFQIFTRTPTLTAMTAAGLDFVSDGRFILGLGASGPQVVEGWYGQPYPKPLARTREYVSIVRSIVERKGPVEFHGEFFDLPYKGGTGLGKALKSTVHPVRTDIPIFLGAEGPKNVAMAAEIADGWLPFLFSPKADAFYRAALAEGFARPAARRTPETFEVCAGVPVIVHDNVEEAADFIRPFIALYVGGMGARTANFHRDVVARLGYEKECDAITDLYLAGNKKDAIAAVPTALVEDLALIGPPAKIRDEAARWRETVITTLMIQGDPSQLRTIAEILNSA